MPFEVVYVCFCVFLLPVHVSMVVMCEYSKFQIESNSYFSIRFDSKRVQIFEIFEYLPSPISYLFKQNDAKFFTLETTPSNQQNNKHYGLPSTETPTAETTIVLNSAAP